MRIALGSACAILLAQSSFGYIRLGYSEAAGAFVPLTRPDAAAIQYYVNDQVKGGLVSSASGSALTVIQPGNDPVAAIRAALSTWNAAPNLKLKFLPLKTTSAVHSTSDYQMTITFAAAEDLSFLGVVPGKSTGAIAVTSNVWTTEKGKLSNGSNVDKGYIVDADILLNPGLRFSTDGSTPYDVQAVLTHELGHALGANHSSLLGATMFPYSAVGKDAVLDQRLLSSDDMAFVGSVFGNGGMGTISGKVTKADGSAVKAALLTLIDRTGGNTLGAISGADGTWSQTVPPGSYMVLAEPFNDIVGPGNIISLEAAQVTGGFQASVLGGALNPREIAVTAGANVTGTDITVSASTGALSTPFGGSGAVGGSGDIQSLNQPAGPLVAASGTSVDFAIAGGGVDATTSIIILGQGISVRAGSTHVDTKVNFSIGPLLRTTIDVQPRQSPLLATLLVVKGTNVISFSGLIVVVPPTPTFISKGIVSSASYKGGANGDGVVSPGGLYTIFGVATAPTLGPATGALLGGFDDYSQVPVALSGVTVTFDGIPAPMFYSSAGQVNVQVPFELSGRPNTHVQVTFNGSSSDTITVPVVESQPAFFTYTGGPDSIAGNQDYKFNSAQNPEARGNVITLYGTGIGKSLDARYLLATGQGAPAPPPGYSGGSSCTLNGTKTVSVAFTGWTPTAVGLAQWSMVIPSDAPTGTVSVTCTDPRGAVTPPGTLYIK